MAQTVSCDVFTAETEDALHEGCPVLTKRRHVVVSKGQCGVVRWQMRWRDGEVADLSECFPTETSSSESESVPADLPTVAVRFKGACADGARIAAVTGEAISAAEGVIEFPMPTIVCRKAGIYQFEAALTSNGSMFFSDTGLISVEQGMFGDTTQRGGPPSIQDIRMHLRDSQIENDLLQDFEFDDAEIIFAIGRPVQQWNETPPPIAPFTCQNFPYKYHWLNAICGELLRTAAHHYVRNKMKAVAGGLVDDEKNRDDDYLRMAKFYWEEWRHFLATKKVELNVRRSFLTMGSDYSA